MEPFMFSSTMLFRLYREKDSTKPTWEWIKYMFNLILWMKNYREYIKIKRIYPNGNQVSLC